MKHQLDHEISFLKMLLFMNLAYSASHPLAQLSFGFAATFFCFFGIYQIIGRTNDSLEEPCKDQE